MSGQASASGPFRSRFQTIPLPKIEVKLDPNTWHRISIEIVGDHFLAKIDDHVLEATHERFKERKGRIGFVARAEGAQFRNVALWSAKPKP